MVDAYSYFEMINFNEFSNITSVTTFLRANIVSYLIIFLTYYCLLVLYIILCVYNIWIEKVTKNIFPPIEMYYFLLVLI